MDEETKTTIIGDGRQLVFMAIGLAAGVLMALPFTEARASLISCGIIGMVTGQFVNWFMRRRERKAREQRR